jgi:starch synthase
MRRWLVLFLILGFASSATADSRPARPLSPVEVGRARKHVGNGKAYRELRRMAKERGALHKMDVQERARAMDAKSAAGLRRLFGKLEGHRRAGDLASPRGATEISNELVTRVRRGGLTTRQRREIQRVAVEDLARLAESDAERASVKALVRALRLRPQQVAPSEPITLRDRHRRIGNALLATLLGGGLPTAQRIAAIERLGRVAGPEIIPTLRRQAGKDAALRATVAGAIARIERASAMTVVFASMEVKPFAGTGGLGNVMDELPRSMLRLGHRPLVVLPRHTHIDRTKLRDTGVRGWVDEPGGGREPFQLLHTVKDGVDVFFIENDKYFSADRHGIYGDVHGDFGDNPQRYDFFGAALPIALKELERTHPELLPRAPDIVQLNDAHTASAAVALKRDPHFAATKSVYAIHNLGAAYQGRFGKQFLSRLRFADKFYPMGPAELHDEINFAKLGMVESDAVVTVSRGYLDEIKTPGGGEGLDGVLRALPHAWGNLNGVDTKVWNPMTSKALPRGFDFVRPAGKRMAIQKVRERFGLPDKPGVPVVSFVGRLTEQKGIGDVLMVIEDSIRTGRKAQFVVSGNGEPALARRLKALSEAHPDVVSYLPFDPKLEHLIYAGSDLFFMPSRFEPSGLPQMYAARYLTAPIVRAVGGLKESIQPWDAEARTGNGFTFTDDPVAALDRACGWYQGSEQARRGLQRNLALSDFSWDTTSAVEQLTFYRTVLDR